MNSTNHYYILKQRDGFISQLCLAWLAINCIQLLIYKCIYLSPTENIGSNMSLTEVANGEPKALANMHMQIKILGSTTGCLCRLNNSKKFNILT